MGGTFVDQEAEFDLIPDFPEKRGQDRFWVADASIGYRLPNRYGIVSINIKNVLDEQFQFQQSFDPGLEPGILGFNLSARCLHR